MSASKFSTIGSHQSIQEFFKPQDHLEPLNNQAIFSNLKLNHDSKLQAALLKFTGGTTLFQLELKKVEKKIIDQFKSSIDAKLNVCGVEKVDEQICQDVSQQMKSIVIENTRNHFKKILENHEMDATNQLGTWVEAKVASIEKEIKENVKADIDKSLKVFSDILFKKTPELRSIKTQSPQNFTNSVKEYSPTDLDVQRPHISDMIIHKYIIVGNSSEMFKNESAGLLDNKNNSEVITYTKRQINPENISDCDQASMTDNDCPVLITKSVDSVSMQRYITAKNNYRDRTRLSSYIVDNMQVSHDAEINDHTINTKRKSHSFFEKYLRRKKEKERSSEAFGKVQREGKSCSFLKLNNFNEKVIHLSKGLGSNIVFTKHSNLERKGSLHLENYASIELDDKAKIISNINNLAVSSYSKLNVINSVIKEADSTESHIPRINENVSNLSGMDSDALTSCMDVVGPTNIKCNKCDQLIDINELQEHQDYHFALDLSTFVEAQNTLNFSTNSNPKILNKKPNKRGRPSKSSSLINHANVKKLKTIDEFFKPKNQSPS